MTKQEILEEAKLSMPEGWFLNFGERMVNELCDILGDDIVKYEIAQIKEKFGCYDEETEILTKDGWKNFRDITYDDYIATLEDDMDTMTYCRPEDIIYYQYNGDMYNLEYRGASLCVTPNHNLYVAHGDLYGGGYDGFCKQFEYEFATPDKYFGKVKKFKKGATWIGEKPDDLFKIEGYEYTKYIKMSNCYGKWKMNDIEFNIHSLLKFLGFYVAEGHSNVKKGEISIAYNPHTEEELVTQLIKDIGFEPKHSNNGCKRIYSKVFAKWLVDNCGRLAPHKKIPNMIKQMPPEYIEEFLEYLFIGDGHKSDTSNILSTTSQRLCDDVCECLVKAGYAFAYYTRLPSENGSIINGRIVQGKHRKYEINWLKQTESNVALNTIKYTKSYIEEWKKYDGYVGCVTVPNHIVYIRRNGKGVWCGNSLRWYAGFSDFTPLPPEYYDWLDRWEEYSAHCCWQCGATAEIKYEENWLLPWCDDCYAEYRETLEVEDSPS